MEDRQEIFGEFVKKWCDSSNSTPQSEGTIEKVENLLAFRLPESYKAFAIEFGDVYAPTLLDAIVDADRDLHDVLSFHSIDEAVEVTKAYEGAGMPAGYFGFACDCMGNLFCFRIAECVEPRKPDVPVWFFDHDFVTIEENSPSFVDFISDFLSVEKK